MDWASVVSAVIGGVILLILPFINYKLNRNKDSTDTKLNVIHTLANSNLAAANTRLDTVGAELKLAVKEIGNLREMIASMRSERSIDVEIPGAKLEE